jgi:hypothetical protein
MDTLLEGGKLIKKSLRVKYVGEKGGKHVFELQSGEYKIQVDSAK